jgi:two-component system, OmpR family, phosphate regulon sensor histidine kinase PhoR
MRRNNIRYVIVLATFSIVGILITQIYWVRKAFDIKEKQFNQSIQIALRNVAEQIAQINEVALNPKPVLRLTSDYYVVNVNTSIDTKVLEHYLKIEFTKANIDIAYEYGIYDCSTNQMVYGNYVSQYPQEKANKQSNFLTWNEYTYYFGIRFPTKTTYLASEMEVWWFSSVMLLVVIVFFGYTLWVILKQKRLSEIQRDFINNMTHEFKTPISTIAISADLITKPQILQKPDYIIKYANVIKAQNLRLKNQIEKVLQMALLEKTKVQLNLEKINILTLVEEVVANFNLNQNVEINTEWTFENEEHAIIQADKVHLTNIIYNLLDNAVKYVENEPKIHISGKYIAKKIVLDIQDNGIGISKEHQKRIFEKFYRVPTGNVHNVKGFGLGLNYVGQIIKAHKWEIKVKSELGKGTCFEIIM